MKWYSVKKYDPDFGKTYIVRADIGYDEPIYFTADWVGYGWDVEVMEKICGTGQPFNCVEIDGNKSYKITHFMPIAPVEIEE